MLFSASQPDPECYRGYRRVQCNGSGPAGGGHSCSNRSVGTGSPGMMGGGG